MNGATPEVFGELNYSDRTWQRFMEDSDQLYETMMMPLAGNVVPGNYYEKEAALAKADLLRGRFRQLSRYAILIRVAARSAQAIQDRES
jgi:hypothetical protein